MCVCLWFWDYLVVWTAMWVVASIWQVSCMFITLSQQNLVRTIALKLLAWKSAGVLLGQKCEFKDTITVLWVLSEGTDQNGPSPKWPQWRSKTAHANQNGSDQNGPNGWKTRPKLPILMSKTAHYVTLYKYRINDVIKCTWGIPYNVGAASIVAAHINVRRFRVRIPEICARLLNRSWTR